MGVNLFTPLYVFNLIERILYVLPLFEQVSSFYLNGSIKHT